MNCTTSCANVASKLRFSNGSCSAVARCTSIAKFRVCTARRNSLGRIDRRYGSRSYPFHQLIGQGTGTASHVEHMQSLDNRSEVCENRSERRRIAAHKPVVGISSDCEGHGQKSTLGSHTALRGAPKGPIVKTCDAGLGVPKRGSIGNGNGARYHRNRSARRWLLTRRKCPDPVRPLGTRRQGQPFAVTRWPPI